MSNFRCNLPKYVEGEINFQSAIGHEQERYVVVYKLVEGSINIEKHLQFSTDDPTDTRLPGW
ncbi:hypothetical protein ACHAPU_010803 [Fusarium lateritium]